MADDFTWLIWALGLVTGLSFAGIPLFVWFSNLRKRDHVWGIVRHKNGQWKAHDVGRPDEKGVIHFKTWSALFDADHADGFKGGRLQHPRPCNLYEENDPNPININVQLIREKGEDGKDHFYKLTSPDREPMPGHVFGRALMSHLTDQALGGSSFVLYILIALVGGLFLGAAFIKLVG